MKNLLLIGVLALCLNSYGQSKKQQIVALNYSIDSLNVLLSTTRDRVTRNIGELNTTIAGLNYEIAQINSDLSELESSVSTLEKDKSKLTKENDKLKTDLQEMEAKLNVIKFQKLVGLYKLVQIDGIGGNCNCGCEIDIVELSNWAHQGTLACGAVNFRGVQEVDDYLNSFKIQIGNDTKFDLFIDNEIAFSGLLGVEILNALTYKFKRIESSNSSYVVNGLLFGTTDRIKKVLLFENDNNQNKVNLSFEDGDTNYILIFEKIKM